MQHLFWRLNFLLLSGVTNSKQMYHEASALARELDPQWNSRSKELMTLFSKAKAYESGERVSAARTTRRSTLPRMTPLSTCSGSPQTSNGSSRRSSVCGWPRSVIESATRFVGAAAGAVDRETFLEAAESRRAQARMLRAEGLSIRAIAALMAVSKTAVVRYLSDCVSVPCP